MSTFSNTSVSPIDQIATRIPDPPEGIVAHREVLARAVALIAERFPPKQIVLYGSRVYGAPTAGSDADLMVVMETSLTPARQGWAIHEAVRSATPSSPLRIDVKVRTPDRIQLGLAERDFLLKMRC